MFERADANRVATGCGTYPRFSATSRTRRRVDSAIRTPDRPPSTTDTVACETPAMRAMSACRGMSRLDGMRPPAVANAD